MEMTRWEQASGALRRRREGVGCRVKSSLDSAVVGRRLVDARSRCTGADEAVVNLAFTHNCKTVSTGRRRFREEFQHVFRVIKGLILITFVSATIILIATSYLTIQDIFVCLLAFSPTGWGLILVAQALKPAIVQIGLWSYIESLARGYDIAMGFLLFSVVLLAWFPSVSEFQTRILFNPAFSR